MSEMNPEDVQHSTEQTYTPEELAAIRKEAAEAGLKIPESDEALLAYLDDFNKDVTFHGN